MGCCITKGVSERCIARLLLTFKKVLKCLNSRKQCLTNILVQEKEEETDSASESEQQVSSAQNEPENTFSDAPLLEEDAPSSPKSSISIVFKGNNWEIPLDTQDKDKDDLNPKITSCPLPCKFKFSLIPLIM